MLVVGWRGVGRGVREMERCVEGWKIAETTREGERKRGLDQGCQVAKTIS